MSKVWDEGSKVWLFKNKKCERKSQNSDKIKSQNFKTKIEKCERKSENSDKIKSQNFKTKIEKCERKSEKWEIKTCEKGQKWEMKSQKFAFSKIEGLK